MILLRPLLVASEQVQETNWEFFNKQRTKYSFRPVNIDKLSLSMVFEDLCVCLLKNDIYI